MRLCLLLFILLTLFACQKPPGETISVNGTTNTIKNFSVRATEMISPFQKTMPKDRYISLFIGNNSNKPVSLKLHGLDTEEISLLANSWTHLKALTVEASLSLQWEGNPLFLGDIYVHPEMKESQQSVLLISADTLRKDYFSKEHMPKTYEIFKREGFIFENIKTSAPWTLPAHVSLLTSLYPANHGVALPEHRLADEPLSIAEVFQKQGYLTAAITEGNYMSARYGVDQGFHSFFQNPPNMMASSKDVSKLEENLAKLEELEVLYTGSPRFFFFHTYEVHCPYLPHGNLQDPKGYGQTQWLLDNEGNIEDPQIYSHLKDLYKAEVQFLDEHLSKAIERFLARGFLIILTSDHGEEFGEHGGLLHADTLYEEVTHIPFAMAGMNRKGVVQSFGSIIDIAPTLLNQLSIPIPEDWQGQDLLATDIQTRPIFSDSSFLGPHIPAQDPRILAIWQEQDKLIRTKNFEEFKAEFYRLELDPTEAQNLFEKERERSEALFLYLKAYEKRKGAVADLAGELTEEELETMRSLGYIK